MYELQNCSCNQNLITEKDEYLYNARFFDFDFFFFISRPPKPFPNPTGEGLGESATGVVACVAGPLATAETGPGRAAAAAVAEAFLPLVSGRAV